MHLRHKQFSGAALLLFSTALFAQLSPVDGHDYNIDTSPLDGTIALDFMDSIWTVPANGGSAQQLTDGLTRASHPRWSPDGNHILYQTRAQGSGKLWQIDVGSGLKQAVFDTPFHVQDASWHPDGEQLVFASERGETGLDIYAADLPTGLSWSVTAHPGDEVEPAWSANGNHLAYIHKRDGHHILKLRKKGEAELELVVSKTPLSSPSWRPDGSILTYLRYDGSKWLLQMAILSTPVLLRTISSDEDFFPAPVRWRDRMNMLYAADGQIKTRGFEDRRSRPLYFRAAIEKPATVAPRIARDRQLDIVAAPNDRLVIRADRLFDGIWSNYRQKMDVLIEGGLIVAVESRRDWPGETVLDLGNATLMPGLIDSWSALSGDTRATDGAALLSYGVTTLVTPDAPDAEEAPAFDASLWEGEATPGPRLLRAGEINGSAAEIRPVEPLTDAHTDLYLARLETDMVVPADAVTAVAELHRRGIPVVVDSWNIGRRTGANVFLGTDWLPARETDSSAFAASDSITLISGLADAGTPGIDALLRSRQAVALGHAARPGRRITTVPQLAATATFVVAGSRPNGLPAGLALHAELHAMTASGLDGEQVLRAAGRNAAILLGLENQLGTIAPGAAADLLLVNGDPLSRSGDAINIVAVVRNGRFFSLVRLLELAGQLTSVE